MRKIMAICGKLCLALFLFLAPSVAASQESAPETTASQPGLGESLGYGLGSALASLIYSPLKVTYAGLGLLTGGLGYVLSAGRTEVATSIIYPAVLGDYVITPAHLQGRAPVIFIGPPAPGSQPTQISQSQPPTP
jgi:hypothetical protein